MPSSPTRALLLFTKVAELGKVKSRLAASIGPHMALSVYERLLAKTLDNMRSLQASGLDCHIFLAEETTADISHFEFAQISYQSGNNLGERMQNAFDILLSQYQSVVIIGGDCPELTTDTILKAFDAVERKHAVIGPSTDGGYYLLGLHKPCPSIFQHKEWSTNTVFKSTISDFNAQNEEVEILDALTDIDTVDDLILAKASNLLL